MAYRELKEPRRYLLALTGALFAVALAPMANAGEPIRFSTPAEDLGLTAPNEEKESEKSKRPRSFFDSEAPSPGPAISVPTPSQGSGRSSRRMLEEMRQRRENWLFFMGEDDKSSDSPGAVFEEEAKQWIGMGRASAADMQYYFEGSGFDNSGAQGETNHMGSAQDDNDGVGFGSDSDDLERTSGNERMTWGRFFDQGQESRTGLGQIPASELASQSSDPWLPLNGAPSMTGSIGIGAGSSAFNQGPLSNGRLNSDREGNEGFDDLFGTGSGGQSMFQHEDPIAPMFESSSESAGSYFGQSDSQSGGDSFSPSASTGSPFGSDSQPSGTAGLNGGLLGQSSDSSSGPDTGSSSRRRFDSNRRQSGGFSAPTVLEVPRRGGF